MAHRTARHLSALARRERDNLARAFRVGLAAVVRPGSHQLLPLSPRIVTVHAVAHETARHHISLAANIVASRCFNASSARWARCETVTGASTTKTPPTLCRAIDTDAPSKSSTVAADTMWSPSPSFSPAGLTDCKPGACEGVVGFTEHADPCCLRHHFLQHLHRLGVELGGQLREPGDVAAGMHQARDEAVSDGIGRVGHDDGNLARCLLNGRQGGR